ncbi:hypothetical protein [Lacticaseibacillus manihotivorans]|uniref:Uncharacterized protein n=1 Tax=Lacticaseibacillus manihotivorans TaxID=88233 RepID=A0A5P8JTJ3_9LACO|nr:hypothetical protein [Lacticaseibacillus manihotivorans]QFQ92090.1 hypothetical protein LM010_11960 [Lacticaseibacillus manihotivorans]
MENKHRCGGVYFFARDLHLARKFVKASTLATLRKTGQVASAAGSRDQQKSLMLFCLDFEPKKTTLFQNLPVESAHAAKTRRHS